MTAPDEVWADLVIGMFGSTGRWVTQGLENPFGRTPYVRRDLAVLAALPDVQELIRAETERCAKVAIAQKGDGTATLDHPYDKGYLAACDAIAAAIRGTKP